MMTILAASVLGSWTYAGFLAEPAPSPGPDPAPTPPPASAPAEPATIEADEKPAEAPPSAPAKAPATRAAASPPPIAAPPTRYRLTDASGQTWEHGDPATLSSFVQARNHSLASYSLVPPATFTSFPAQDYRSSRCSNGRCN